VYIPYGIFGREITKYIGLTRTIYIRCIYGIFGREITKYIGLARTIYIRCIYGIFGREITKYTVYMYVYIRFWPTLEIYGVYNMVLANPREYTCGKLII